MSKQESAPDTAKFEEARPGLGVGGLPTSAGVAGAPAGDGGAGDAGRWQVHRLLGAASALHERSWPEHPLPSVWLLAVDSPALVLGSTQAEAVVDRRAAEVTGVEIVRRRTGGGAVLLRPGAVLWVDVLLPAGDALWCSDVGRAFWWLGEVWVEALTAAGVAGARWHDGPLIRSPLSDVVCFAGLGPGEVTVEGRKVVGMSQRRTRGGALFQCAASLVWEPGVLAALLGLDEAELAATTASGLEIDRAVLENAFLGALTAR